MPGIQKDSSMDLVTHLAMSRDPETRMVLETDLEILWVKGKDRWIQKAPTKDPTIHLVDL